MSTTILEREIKLRFSSADEAREAVIAAGATPMHGRRLQVDALLDTEDEQLRRQRCVLRVRKGLYRSLSTVSRAISTRARGPGSTWH